MSAAPQEWVILRLRYGPHDLWVNYEDSRGNKRTAPVKSRARFQGFLSQTVTVTPSPPIGFVSLEVKVPADLHQLIFGLLSELPPQQSGPHGTGPVPLAIFLDAPTHTPIESWESVVEYLLPPGVDNQTQFVTVHSRLLKRRSKLTPFSLPLRVLAAGDACADALKKMQSAVWYINNPEVQRYGINLETSPSSETARRLKAQQWDIVLTDSESITEVMAYAAQSSSRSRPRLIIFFGPVVSEAYVRNLTVPVGTAFLWVPQLEGPFVTTISPEFLKNFLYGVIHDYPLHEALKSAIRGGTFPLPRPPVLIADPISNNSLRFSDAVSHLIKEAEKIRPWSRLGDISKFITRAGMDVTEALRDKLWYLDDSRSRLLYEVNRVKETPSLIVFDQETEGLVPLATAVRALEHAHTEHKNIGATAAAIVNIPQLCRVNRETSGTAC